MTARVDRTRLLTVIAHTPGLWIVEACAGSGKSELARQIATRFGGAVSSRMPEDLAHADATVVVDVDVGTWNPDPDEVAFLRGRPDGALTVVCTRLVGEAGRAPAVDAGARWLRSADLWFDDNELERLAQAERPRDDRRSLGSLAALTDGWPMAVEACSAEARRASGDFGSAASAAFAEVFDPAVGLLSEPDRAGLAVMSYFDRFDAEMAGLIDRPKLLETLVLGGVPLLNDGRWSRLGPVARSRLRSGVAQVPDVNRAVFDHLAERGHLIESIEAAVESNRLGLAAEIFSSLDYDGAGSLDDARAGAVWARLGPVLPSWPRAHLVRAWQQLSTGKITATIDLLTDRLNVATQLDVVVREQMVAELAFAQYLSGDLDGARSWLAEESFTSDLARARTVEVEAGLAALTKERKALVTATEGFLEAARLWAQTGSMGQAAATLGRLALEVTMPSGHLTEALEHMDRVLVTIAADPARRASVQLMRARMLALAGRDAEAEKVLQEVDGLVGTVQRTWIAIQAHRARALIASHRGHSDEVLRRLTLAEKLLGDLAQHASGALLHIDAIESCARCGLAEKAREHLELLRGHPRAEPPDVAISEIIVECRTGDAALGLELIGTFRTTDTMPPGGDWRLDFLASVALGRLGREEEAAAARARAEIHAASVGTPGIIEATESFSLETQTSVAPVECNLFPDFAVRLDDQPVDIPPGQPRTVLKALVLNGGRLTLDELTEVLWPEGDPVIGRRRLRNVLSRVRSACGEVLVRNGEALSLADDVRSDFSEWWDASVVALEMAEPDEATLSALLSQVPNVLLPSDRYEDWLQPLQRRYQLQLLRLCDLQARTAEAHGHVDAAVGAYVRGHEIDPWDGQRLEQAINLLRANGRTSAIAALERLRPDELE